MTVFSLLKGAFLCISFMGLILTGVGAWKVWSAYDFARNAEIKEGIFRGYHLHRYKSSTRDSSGARGYRMIEKYLPMFSYRHSGRRYETTGTDTHVFRHLRNKVNEPVTVLVSPDDPKAARLGDVFSLYGPGGGMAFFSLVFVILPWYGARFIDRWRHTTSTAVAETQSAAGSFIDSLGQMTIPVHDFVIVFGVFLLIAGCMGGYIYYITVKRESTSLIETLRARDYESARILAVQGRGIGAKTPEGESALILALKANQPDVSRAILRNHWVNTHVKDVDGTSAIQMAAANGDRWTLSLLLKKGELVHDIQPAAIFHLVRKGDVETLEFLLENGFELDRMTVRPSYGDQAVLEGQADVVRLIQKYHGSFNAPPAFVALAVNDEEALRRALESPRATEKKFLGLTLERLAEKTGRTDLLERTRKE